MEEAKIINGRLNKYAREIAEINIKALNLKEEVIKNAFEDKIKAMDEKSFDINKVEDDLIANFSENKTKNIVKDFFNKNRHNLLNKEKAEIKNLVFDLFKKENNNTNIYLSSSLEEISEEKEVYNNVIDNFKKLQISKNTLSKEQFNEKQIEFETKKIFTQVDEAARRDSIRKIIASIKERGFIVNPNNIRHIKENGEDKVILFSQKVTGEEAIFTVYLDGRFNYKFEGYEGHDHDIDSEPFLERLTMYDVSLSTEQKKVYFNPDRIKKAAKMGHKPNSNKNNQ
ncbi:hypothetical protein NPX79_02725 [Spiroplasma endosymbiont of Anurida maritima]|uniref:hypothetical protein n=1 Tax=Spiroplasma endosymbiont of Anurida maritima TaxID=2967972 RepID=UPI0036D3A5E4